MMTLQYAASCLSTALSRFHGYDNLAKQDFGKAAKSFLRCWAKAHNQVGKIHWNQGGIAVSGEVHFHAADYDIQISESLGDLPCIMFRYQIGYGSGGPNNFATPEAFADMTIEQFNKLVYRPEDGSLREAPVIVGQGAIHW